MVAESAQTPSSRKPDYGWDAPYAARNLSIASVICFILGLLLPHSVHLGPVNFLPKPMFFGTAVLCFVEVLLFWHYVRRGKFRHRDFILGLHAWRGDEQVLDVGCGRGLLLAGAAKRATQGLATGLDIWSQEDLSGNSEAAARQNLSLEGVDGRCTLVSAPAQQMPFADGNFDVVVSNVCLHNIYDRATRRVAIEQIARVLRPGGQALLSDYKLTSEYAKQLGQLGFQVERRWGSLIDCFPPMCVVVARKPEETGR